MQLICMDGKCPIMYDEEIECLDVHKISNLSTCTDIL